MHSIFAAISACACQRVRAGLPCRLAARCFQRPSLVCVCAEVHLPHINEQGGRAAEAAIKARRARALLCGDARRLPWFWIVRRTLPGGLLTLLYVFRLALSSCCALCCGWRQRAPARR